MKKTITTIIMALGATLLPTTSSAYIWTRTCNNNPVIWDGYTDSFQIRTGSFPTSSQEYIDILYSINEWNEVRGMANIIQTPHTSSSTDPVDHDDTLSTIYYSASQYIPGDAAAYTWVEYDVGCIFEQKIIAADIGFDQSINWTFGNPVYHFTPYPEAGFRSAAIHELGHALGFRHETRWMSMMNPTLSSARTNGTYSITLMPDDAYGGRNTYPISSGTYHDLYTSDWTYLDGEATINNSSLGLVVFACKDDTIDISWSRGNMGTVGTPYYVEFFLSGDEIIQGTYPYDIFIGSHSGYLSSGGFGTIEKSFTLDSFLIQENTSYYIGYIIDPNNNITEFRENNNGQGSLTRIRLELFIMPSESTFCNI